MNPSIDDALRPLSARSVIASALLGTHPPRLQGRLLVALAEQFGIGAGTARVAMSRMVDRGELANDGGFYELAGGLAERQVRQDLGRDSVGRSGWDGTWEQGLVVESGRAAGDRHRLRQALAAARLGEAREGVWMRPSNLDRVPAALVPADLADHVVWLNVRPADGDASVALVHTVFDVGEWASVAKQLNNQMLEPHSGLADRFRLAAAVLQHLTRDPLLPAELYPHAWPADDLRERYRDYEHRLQAELRQFFATAA